MDERNNDFDFDFMPIGQAIKKAREARGMTREQLAGIIGYAPRHIQSIENEGQHPSIELFIQLVVILFDLIYIGFQDTLTAHGIDQPDFKARQLNIRRKQIHALMVMQDAL